MSKKSEFIETVVDPIQGWLYPFAAIRTLDLLEWQENHEVTGSVFEIGVFCGKYFSTLLHSANNTNSPAAGLDTFEHVPPNQVIDLLGRNGANSDRIKFLEGKSTDFSVDQMKDALGGVPARFISVDGSHEKADVSYDLRASDELLADRGIIAADDFLNCLCMGVTEAVIDHLRASKTLVPFAYIPNKLLMCRPGMADHYTEILIDANANDPFDSIGERLVNTERKNLFTTLAGRPVLAFS